MAEELGIDIVVREHTASTTSEMTSLTELKALNPDILYIASTPQPSSIIIKNAYDLEMTSTGMVIACGHAAMTKAWWTLPVPINARVFMDVLTVSWEEMCRAWLNGRVLSGKPS